MSLMMKDRETPFQEGHMREGEWQARCDLAAAYRLVAMFGWDDLIGTHLSARIPGTHDEFLINPLGQMFDEITASSLVKVNMDGEILQNTPFTINKAGFVIHSAVHAARNDVDCVIHLHTRDGVAVSATDTGLLPLNQSAMVILPHIARHAYEGVAINEEERERLVADLGGKPMMLLDNHGTLCVGSTVGEAFNYIYMLEWACSTQVRTLSMGLPIRRADPQVVHNTGELLMVENLEQFKAIVSDLVWPALLRKLDRTNPGYRE